MSSSSITKAPPAAQVTANVSTAQVFPNAFNTQIPAILIAPAQNVVEQRKFLVRATGYCTTAATLNVQVTIYAGTALPTIAAPGTAIVQAAAQAANSLSTPWSAEAELYFDSVSGKLHGVQRTIVNNTMSAYAAVANVITGVAGKVGSAEPALYFAVAISFSVANAGNIGNLNEFVLDA